ncbi:MAG: hypothetical protein NXI04_01120 [Planctomycetaceae bacterium]|nr:hypothetical protein [Planctomycetaceae bacterium]
MKCSAESDASTLPVAAAGVPVGPEVHAVDVKASPEPANRFPAPTKRRKQNRNKTKNSQCLSHMDQEITDFANITTEYQRID